jgi:hypothetical protein
MEVTCHHADGAPRRARNGGFPQLGSQLLDEEDRHPVVGAPSIENRISKVGDDFLAAVLLLVLCCT